MEQALELHLPDLITPQVRDTIQGYNEDDCISALRLRDWLESSAPVLRPKARRYLVHSPQESGASENVNEREQRVAALRAKLLEGVTLEPGTRDADQEARWLIAYLLDWHRREDKASWWEYFRLLALPEEDLFDEPRAIGISSLSSVWKRFSAKRASRPDL
jgi:uncharacterized protein